MRDIMLSVITSILLIGTILTITGVLSCFGTTMVAGTGIIVIGMIAGAFLIPIKKFWKILWGISIIFLFSGLITMFFTGTGFLFLIAAAVIGGISWLCYLISDTNNKEFFLFSKKK